ncbi:IscS subfamily cysteine desulfurase [Aliidiomarina sanyensis]|uniref:cysteine desulfurase n=1 Tax=Aliidiomarina sanyensis TaxID=1249555 RepID=A0A432WG51_9GAMM|nr:IscS subfamily cysteine desulfurase [Aliidiomarina sanyensis]RUO32758.1 IscS subfamily cysteine desulfurase [Aliidiomarina sanyensis]
MRKPVYLDYAATTPVDPRVAECMMGFLTMDGVFGNPASRSHRFGWQAEEAVDIAREQIAQLIHADPREIVFTSGATEASNLAIKGVMEFHQNRGKHVVTVVTEHKATLDTCAALEAAGFEVTYLPVDAQGALDLADVQQALRPDTVLLSVMQVNNETGVMHPIRELAQLAHENGTLIHVDAAQSVGKIAVDVRDLDVDLMSISAHKMYGPKGIGALFVRRNPRVLLQSQIHGGGHERGMRSGTLAPHQIAGFGQAAAIASEALEQDGYRIGLLRAQLWTGLQNIPGIVLNTDLKRSVPGILNIGFEGIEGETLLMALGQLAVSSGSACNSASVEPSYVLRAMGRSDAVAHASIRLSVGRFTTEEEIDFAAQLVNDTVTGLRSS